MPRLGRGWMPRPPRQPSRLAATTTPVSSSYDAPIEENQGVLALLQDHIEEAQGAVSATGGVFMESALSISRSLDLFIEGLTRVTNTTGEAVDESAGGIAATAGIPLDEAGAVSAAGVEPVEAVAAVVGTPTSFVEEGNQGVASPAVLVEEAVQGAVASVSEVIEATKGAAASVLLPIEETQRVGSGVPDVPFSSPVVDTFTRADNSGALGGNWLRLHPTGSLGYEQPQGIIGNQGYDSLFGIAHKSAYYYNTVATGAVETYMTVPVIPGYWFGHALRAANPNGSSVQFYACQAKSDGSWTISRLDSSSSETTLGSGTAGTWSNGDKIGARVFTDLSNNVVIELWQQHGASAWTKLATATDTSGSRLLADGYAGIIFGNAIFDNAGRFDDFGLGSFTPGGAYPLPVESTTGVAAAIVDPQEATKGAAATTVEPLEALHGHAAPTVGAFYLHDDLQTFIGGTPPPTGATISANTNTDGDAAGAFTNRAMDGNYGIVQTSASDGIGHFWGEGALRRFVSPPLAAQTIPSGTWTFAIGASVNPSDPNISIEARVVVWRPDINAKVATILDNFTSGPGSIGTSEANYTFTFSGPSTPILTGDVLVLEVWGQNGGFGSPTLTIYYDGDTEGSSTSNAARLVAPAALTLATGMAWGSAGMTLESLLGVAQTKAEIIEATGAVAAVSSDPVESQQVATITQTGVFPIEEVQALAVVNAELIEALDGLVTSALDFVEATQLVVSPPLVGSSYSAEVMNDSPSYFWKLWDTSGTAAADSSGNGRPATYVNSPTLGVASIKDADAAAKSVTLNGTNQYVERANETALHPSGSFTAELVVRPNSGAGNYRCIATTREENISPFGGWLLYLNDTNKFEVRHNDSVVGSIAMIANNAVTNGVAYHVVFGYDAAAGKFFMYVDKVLQTSQPAATHLQIPTTSPLRIGARQDNGFFAPVTVQGFSYYPGTVLSSGRVAAHYDALSGGGSTAAFSEPIEAAGAVAGSSIDPVDSIAPQITSTAVLPLEETQPLSASEQDPIETAGTTGGVANTVVVPVEAGAGVAATDVEIVEALQPVPPGVIGGGAAPAYRSSTSGIIQNNHVTTVAKPAGTAAGDLLLVFLWSNDIYNDASNPVAPAGWTREFQFLSGNNTLRYWVYWKIAGASEPSSWQWTTAGSSGYGGWVCHAITGAHQSIPIYAVSAIRTPGDVSFGANIGVPQINVSAGVSVMEVAYAAYTGSTVVPVVPSGFAKREQYQHVNFRDTYVTSADKSFGGGVTPADAWTSAQGDGDTANSFNVIVIPVGAVVIRPVVEVPFEVTQGIAVVAVDPTESATSVATPALEPIASDKGVAAPVVEPIEALRGVGTPVDEPVESNQPGGVLQSSLFPLEAPGGVKQTDAEILDALGAVAVQSVLEPLEATQAVYSGEPTAWDTFTRTIAATSSWGRADSGQTWAFYSAGGNLYTVNGSAATIAQPTVASNAGQTLPISLKDVEVLARIAISAIPTGPIGSTTTPTLMVRYADAANHLRAFLNFQLDGSVSLQMQRISASGNSILTNALAGGVNPTIIAPGGYTAGTFVWLRFSAVGTTLMARAWASGSAEPADWQFAVTDSAVTAAGGVGVRSFHNTGNTNSPTITIDDFTAGPPVYPMVIETPRGVASAATIVMPVDEAQRIAAANVEPIEAVSASVAATSVVPVESPQGVATTKVEQLDAAGAVASTSAEPIDSARDALVTVAAVFPVEAAQGVTASAQETVEALRSLAATAAVVLDGAGYVAAVSGTTVDATTGIQTTTAMIVEEGQGVAAQTPVTLETAAELWAAASFPVETLKALAQTAVTALETTFHVSADLVLPFEAGRKVAAFAVMPMEKAPKTPGVSSITDLPDAFADGVVVVVAVASLTDIRDAAAATVIAPDSASTIDTIPESESEIRDERSGTP